MSSEERVESGAVHYVAVRYMQYIINNSWRRASYALHKEYAIHFENQKTAVSIFHFVQPSVRNCSLLNSTSYIKDYINIVKFHLFAGTILVFLFLRELNFLARLSKALVRYNV